MTNHKRQSVENNKGGCGRSNANDFIGQLPDEILLLILSLLPMKEAVVTSCLSTRWRFLWCQLNTLNFDGSHTFDNIEDWPRVFYSEQRKYFNQVNNVIKSFNQPIVKDFRISFGLNNGDREVIDEWIQFAVNKKVEFLELNLKENVCQDVWEPFRIASYNFPSRLFETNLFKSNATGVELVSLKKLILNNVNVSDTILQEFLQNSPHLESISIHNSGSLCHIRVGGRALKLKHFEIAQCDVKSIYLSDFDLESFTYKGEAIDVRLVTLPKLKEVDMDQTNVEFNDYVLGLISSSASSLQSLSINVYRSRESVTLNSFPVLPNLKKLRLTIGGRKSSCLRDLASIVNACPNLETCTIELFCYSPYKSKFKARDVATHSHEHLKFIEIVGYYGRICDFELAEYIILTAVALKKLVIDPYFKTQKKKEVVLSSIKRKLKSILHDGVQLAIL